MFFLLALFFIVGAAIGSFLNVVIDRTVRGEHLLGRSYCDHCRATLVTLDLVPIVSFVGLGGRCRYCRRKISKQYPIVEILCAILFVAVFYQLVTLGRLDITYLIYLFLVISILIVVATVDIKYSLIPTTLVYVGAAMALFYNYFSQTSDVFVRTVAVAFVLSAVFGLIVLVTRGRGMGTGDIPLVFMIGLVLGWPQAVVSVFLACVFGAAFALVLVAFGKKKFGQTVPFAPFLTMGALTAFFVGEQFLSWYLGLL